MNNAINYLIEPLLKHFFLIDAVCRGFIDEAEKKTILEELAKVFCVPINDETEACFSTAISAVYNDIVDYAAYERLCRTIEFAELTGRAVDLTLADRVVLAQKREAMLAKADIFKQSKNLTADIVAETLLNTATNGNIDAMVTLSYMEYHGLCICEDKRSAMKRLALCAKWNNLFGNLMGIAYGDSDNRRSCYNRLYTILKSSNRREVFKYICDFNSFDPVCEKSPTARIIEKAFGLGIINRNTYDRIFAKAAFSELISAEDKEKLLLNKKKDAIADLSNIPFDVDRGSRFDFNAKKACALPLRREAELDKILCGIFPALHDRSELYNTLLVAGNDEYVADMYLHALQVSFGDEKRVIEVDAGALSLHDFVAAKEHFVLRGLSETKCSHTVFLIKHCEELGERELDELTKLLEYEYRKKFKLMEPTVSLDLSDILIVLFSSAVNASVKRLAEKCDVVWYDKLSSAEKETVIDATFKVRSRSFGIESASLEDAGKRFLVPLGTDRILKIIDGALKKAAYDNETVVTAEALRTVTAQQKHINSRREFGYLRWTEHEEY